jgi:hypothetical protein
VHLLPAWLPTLMPCPLPCLPLLPIPLQHLPRRVCGLRAAQTQRGRLPQPLVRPKLLCAAGVGHAPRHALPQDLHLRLRWVGKYCCRLLLLGRVESLQPNASGQVFERRLERKHGAGLPYARRQHRPHDRADAGLRGGLRRGVPGRLQVRRCRLHLAAHPAGRHGASGRLAHSLPLGSGSGSTSI